MSEKRKNYNIPSKEQETIENLKLEEAKLQTDPGEFEIQKGKPLPGLIPGRYRICFSSRTAFGVKFSARAFGDKPLAVVKLVGEIVVD